MEQNLETGGADRSPNADLTDPFEHRRQHDVHDTDPTNDQGDGGNGSQHHIEDPLRSLLLLEEQLRYRHLEVHHGIVPPLQ